VKIWAVMLAGAVCGGCFPPDLGDGKVACGSSGACPPNYVCRADRHCWKTPDTSTDMAGGSTDMAMLPDTCLAAGMRLCADSGHSGVCPGPGANPTVDRTCPPSSLCSAGRCQPPAGSKPCKKAGDCAASEVCAPFVVGALVDGRCVAPLPGSTGGSTAACTTPGFDPKCGTGYCARVQTLSICAFPCTNTNDRGGGGVMCDSGTTTVEGTADNVKICHN